MSPDDLNQAYESALAATDAPVAALLPAGSHAEQRALERLENYFAAMTVDSVAADTLDVYAADAWLYDNLAIVQGAPAIRDYFVHSAGATRSMRVEFLQTLRDGIDYFVRWKMTIDAPGLADGSPMVSYGMTQFRFDADGRVLLHRDFWDAATGLVRAPARPGRRAPESARPDRELPNPHPDPGTCGYPVSTHSIPGEQV